MPEKFYNVLNLKERKILIFPEGAIRNQVL